MLNEILLVIFIVLPGHLVQNYVSWKLFEANVLDIVVSNIFVDLLVRLGQGILGMGCPM